MMYEGEDVNSIDLLYESKTEEVNGVKIIVPIKYSDLSLFKEKIKEQLCYFENVYFNVEGINNEFKILRSEHYQYSELNNDKYLHICLDNVYYPIDFNKLGINLIEIPIGLRFDLSSGIFPTPNREQLIYTPKTKEIVLNKIKIVANELINKYNLTVVDTDDIKAVIDNYTTIKKEVKLTESVVITINDLKEYSDFKIADAKLKNVNLLDLAIIYTLNSDYWLHEYTYQYSSERGMRSRADSYKFKINKISQRYNYCFYTDKLPLVKKEYLKFAYPEHTVVKKDKFFCLKGSWSQGSLVKILGLNNHPKNEWRKRIKEFKHVLDLVEKTFINVDELVVPKDFVDNFKKQRMTSTKYNNKERAKTGEVVGKVATELMKYTGNYCKWVAENINLDQLSRQPNLYIYGGNEETHSLSQLYSIINKNKTKILIFSEKELKKIENLKIHNLIHYKQFMKGDTKPFKRIVTSYVINVLINNNINLFRNESLEDVSKDLYNKIQLLKEYKSNHYVAGSSNIQDVMLKFAEENNLFDESVYSTYKEVKDILEKLPFLNDLSDSRVYGYSKYSPQIKQYVIDLCKYHKYRVNLDKYGIKINENIITEEQITELEEA